MRRVIKSRRSVLLWVSGAAFLIAVAAVLVFFLLGSPDRLEKADKLASVGSLLFGAVSLLVSVAALGWGAAAPRRDGAVSPADEVRALDPWVARLADRIRGQWTEEAATRTLGRPDPLELRWSSSGRPGASPIAVLGKGTIPGRPTRLRLHGSLSDVVAAFRKLPRKQLMVLGEHAAGKTVLALLFTLGMLRTREPAEPVPVLLTASSWDPARERLDVWFARRLREEYPFLADQDVHGTDVAWRLVHNARVMLVLDGLDEMPGGLHATAIKAINRAVIDERPLVITCRGAEYAAAVAAEGQPLAHAAVVEIEPVKPEDAVDHLRAALPTGDDRWGPMFDHLLACPDGPLARSLSSPLMVSLTLSAYAPPGTEPSDLLDLGRFPDRSAIEHHLLDAFLPTVYPARSLPPPDRPGSPATPIRAYEHDQARAWLAHLARHLRALGTRDLGWWELHRTLPRGGFELMAGLAAGLTAGPVMGLMAGLVFGRSFLTVAGCGTGLGVGVGAALVSGFKRRPSPSRVRLPIKGRRRHVLRGVLVGVTVGVFSGLVFGVVFWFMTGGSGIGLMAGVVAGVTGGIGVGLGAGLTAPVGPEENISPRSLLDLDRATALTQAFGGGLGAGLMVGVAAAMLAHPAARLGAALVAGAGVGIGVTLIAVSSTAWGRWMLIRAWLVFRKKLPWRVMDFLDHAHRHGVLRQVGGSYQFRHARLQDHLIDFPAIGGDRDFAAGLRSTGIDPCLG
ncbi:hypothetical protein [Nonomuraea sp. NPDC049028]|uniref:hypothetical protein n=1 Tax=Nonomuraea sp. NPDC049028 TaxID=3364348 RepID=UPI0037121032